MKKYVFLTSSIGNMGGAQMFLSNKVEYLRKHGWEVEAFFFNSFTEIKIPNLKRFENNCIPELMYKVQSYSSSQREVILDRICSCLKKNGRCEMIVVESLLTHLAFWAELIAERVNGIHVVDYLEEDIPVFSKRQIDFFDFKLRRRECLNASKKSLQRLFKDFYLDEYESFFFVLMPFCSNVIDENNETNIDIKSADYTILSIGRLDKPYIQTLLNELVSFIRLHSQTKFNMIFIGGSADGSVEKKISSLFRVVENVKVYLLGYLYPIPKILFENVNVSIASSNSVLVTAELGIPTIVIDANDFHAIGVYGYDTQNKVFRTIEPLRNVSDLLEEVLLTDKYTHTELVIKNNGVSADDVFNRQLNFLKTVPGDNKYYDVNSVFSRRECLIAWIRRNIHSVLKKFGK